MSFLTFFFKIQTAMWKKIKYIHKHTIIVSLCLVPSKTIHIGYSCWQEEEILSFIVCIEPHAQAPSLSTLRFLFSLILSVFLCLEHKKETGVFCCTISCNRYYRASPFLFHNSRPSVSGRAQHHCYHPIEHVQQLPGQISQPGHLPLSLYFRQSSCIDRYQKQDHSYRVVRITKTRGDVCLGLSQLPLRPRTSCWIVKCEPSWAKQCLLFFFFFVTAQYILFTLKIRKKKSLKINE